MRSGTLSVRFILVLALGVGSWGCSIHQMTGDTMSDYTRTHLIPYLLEKGTLENACELGVSMGPFVNSFERVTDAPHHAAVPTLVSSATCSQERAWQSELRYLRAIGRAQISEAKDARIAAQQWHGKAAYDLKRAYERTVALFGDGQNSCPNLETQEDQMIWLLGMVAGVQATQHDGAAANSVGVSLDIPVKAMRAMRCVDNQKWWGMPGALRAAVWIIVPGSNRDVKDESGKVVEPYAALEASIKIAEQSEIKSAFAIAAMVFENVGRTQELRKTVARYAKASKDIRVNSTLRMLEMTARRQLMAISDRIWTNEVGHRTPLGKLGEFPQSASAEEPSQDDDMLEDL